MKNKFSSSTIIATFFGAGYIPFAPGTFASALAFILYFLVIYLVTLVKGGSMSLTSPELANNLLVFYTGLFFIGSWAAEQYCQNNNKQDPKEVVIDEVVGQSLTIMLIFFFLPYVGHDVLRKIQLTGIGDEMIIWLNLLSSFVLFRIFDISKPWPISSIDKNIKNGFGVMLDDIAAAFFAALMHFFILFAIADRL